MALTATDRELVYGLVYSQFYSQTKASFDVAKTYCFDNEGLENLALDPSYVRTLQHVCRGTVFTEATCRRSYLKSKIRANQSTRDGRKKSFGTREEHRVSFRL